MDDPVFEAREVPPELWRVKETSISLLRAQAEHLEATLAAEAAGHTDEEIRWWARGTGWDEEPEDVDE